MNPNDLKRIATRAEADRGSREAAARLRDAALDEGLVDVAVSTLPSPVGHLFVAVTPRGLALVHFGADERDAVVAELAEALSPRIVEARRATEEVRRELGEYFDGRRTRFGLRVDRRLIRGIAREVLGATARIPFGRTSTYGEIAERIGRPKAARAVGNALGSNPIPIVIPCHRVLRSGGQLGGYGGGIARKELLLRLEGVLPTPLAPGR